MAKKRDRRESAAAAFVHQPFRGLGQLAGRLQKGVPPHRSGSQQKTSPAAPPRGEIDPAEEFLRAVAGVKRLDAGARDRIPAPAPASPPREITGEDAEALAELCDLVSGEAPFDVTQSDEHVEGSVVGLDPRLLRRLRQGEFAYQDHIDLHGLTSEEARVRVDAFLTRAYQTHKRCVLIVHGRGLSSKDKIPVLKSRVTGWLSRGRWARIVLAFSSARSYDGGTGALYVLLRRDRSAKHGAKW
jgi:DNA-nicking Smr family endonuclease